MSYTCLQYRIAVSQSLFVPKPNLKYHRYTLLQLEVHFKVEKLCVLA